MNKTILSLMVLLLLGGCATPAQRVETAKETLIIVVDESITLVETGLIDEDTARLILSLSQHAQMLVAEAEAAVVLGQNVWKPLLRSVADITRRLIAIKIYEQVLKEGS